MVDIDNMNDPKHAIPDRELTTEFVVKWDSDLATISALGDLANELGDDFVLKGGMATVAHLGGVQYRAHGDIDATYYLEGDSNFENISEEVNSILRSEATNWEKYTSPVNKVEYRENNEALPFFSRRRLELYILKDKGKVYETGKYQVKQLVDSSGKAVEVKVMELHELIAMKVRKLFQANTEIVERETNLCDYTDLQKLMKLPGFSREKVIILLSKYFKKGSDLEKTAEAEKEFLFVTDLLSQL